MTESLHLPAQRGDYRVITCVMPAGRGAEVLEILRREQLVQRAATQGAVLGQRLHTEFGDHPAVVDIRGRGMFYGLELRCSRDAVVQAAMERDMWVYPAGSGPVADAVMVAPPFIISDSEIDLLVATLRESLDAVFQG